jgi:hypothetical protein
VLTRLAEVEGGAVLSKLKMPFAEAKTCTDYASGCSFCPCGAMRLRLVGTKLEVNEQEVSACMRVRVRPHAARRAPCASHSHALWPSAHKRLRRFRAAAPTGDAAASCPVEIRLGALFKPGHAGVGAT